MAIIDMLDRLTHNWKKKYIMPFERKSEEKETSGQQLLSGEHMWDGRHMQLQLETVWFRVDITLSEHCDTFGPNV